MYHLRPAADLVIVHSHSAYIQSSLCIYNPIGHEYLYPDALCREPLSADFKSWLRRPRGQHTKELYVSAIETAKMKGWQRLSLALSIPIDFHQTFAVRQSPGRPVCYRQDADSESNDEGPAPSSAPSGYLPTNNGSSDFSNAELSLARLARQA
jgi:hypothetical protein